MSSRIYFAHAVNSYNTPIELAAEHLIEKVQLVTRELTKVILGQIENPNQPHHQKGYEEYAQRIKRSDTSHKGMNYFYDVVLPNCDGCVAMPFLDGKLGLGVAGEALWFVNHERPLWFMDPKADASEEDPERFFVDPTSGLFHIRSFNEHEIEMLRDPKNKELGSKLVLSHEETRLRTWLVYGKEMRPYEKAHLVSLPIPVGFYLDE